MHSPWMRWEVFFKDRENRDLLLVVILIALTLAGLLILYSASASISEKEFNIASYYVRRQILWALMGITSMVVAAMTPVEFIRRMALPFLLLMIVLLALVYVPGVGHSVSSERESFHRWIGFGSITFQPSEFAKIAIIIYVAHLLSRGDELRTEHQLKRLIPGFALLSVALGAIILEPQYGTTICILLAVVTIVYISGFPMLRLLLLFLAALPLLFLLAILWQYRLDRFRVWLDPYQYRYQGGYQLVMSFRAMQEGGWWGNDVATGIAHRYLTYGHTDFILALFAEDYGFLGVLLLFLLFLLFTWRSGTLIQSVNLPFPFLMASGSLVMLISQALLNLAVVTGLLPTTGVSLPFISYGGSSLITSLIFGGLIVNASQHRMKSEMVTDYEQKR